MIGPCSGGVTLLVHVFTSRLNPATTTLEVCHIAYLRWRLDSNFECTPCHGITNYGALSIATTVYVANHHNCAISYSKCKRTAKRSQKQATKVEGVKPKNPCHAAMQHGAPKCLLNLAGWKALHSSESQAPVPDSCRSSTEHVRARSLVASTITSPAIHHSQ